jgi:hypothetical protein
VWLKLGSISGITIPADGSADLDTLSSGINMVVLQLGTDGRAATIVASRTFGSGTCFFHAQAAAKIG